LVALADLERQVTLWSTWEIDGPTAIELLKKMWELSDQEGYWYGRGEIAEDATAIAVAHSE
jgi:DNA-binding IclR family transcriptional regulator